MSLISIGFGNYISKDRVVAVVLPNSAPLKRLKEQLEAKGMVIDATQGRKTRALIFTDSGHLILSGISVETIAERMNK